MRDHAGYPSMGWMVVVVFRFELIKLMVRVGFWAVRRLLFENACHAIRPMNSHRGRQCSGELHDDSKSVCLSEEKLNIHWFDRIARLVLERQKR
ncbi:hypothetical protein HN51_000133 [Arachis hypogaea]